MTLAGDAKNKSMLKLGCVADYDLLSLVNDYR